VNTSTEEISITALLDAIKTLISGAAEHPPFDGFLHYLEQQPDYAFAALYIYGPVLNHSELVLCASAEELTGLEPSPDRYVASAALKGAPGERFTLRERGIDTPLTRDYVTQFLKPNGIADVMVLNLNSPSTFDARLVVGLSPDQKRFENRHHAFFAQLQLHLESALQSFNHLAMVEAKARLYNELAERMGVGEIRLDEQGCIIDCNTMADAVLSESHLLRRNGERLQCPDPEDDALLQSQIKRYLEAKPIQPSEPLYLHSRDPVDLIGLLIRQLPALEAGPREERAMVGIYLGDHTRRTSLSVDLLKKLYDLSGAEARIAVHLAQGRSAREIAELEHISHTTVRTHIAHIYAKTGINRQAELTARLISTLPALWLPLGESERA
jgi:DNA-binding CsgD family transcriptional regulator/PAS domain-containing protein